MSRVHKRPRFLTTFLRRTPKFTAVAITLIGLISGSIGIIQFLSKDRHEELLREDIKRTIKHEVTVAIGHALQAALQTEEKSVQVRQNAITSMTIASKEMRKSKALRTKIESIGSEAGLTASQARFLALNARKSDLELRGQEINQMRIQIANAVANLLDLAAKTDSETSEAQPIQQRINTLQKADKSLEMQLRRIDTQQQAVQTEIRMIQRVIDKNIEMSFRTFG